MAIIDDVVIANKRENSIKGAARSAHVSEQKVRKLLITAGLLQPEASRQALLYLSRGLKKKEVAQKLGISTHTRES